MPQLRLPTHWRFLSSGGFLLLVLLLAGCGGSTTSGVATTNQANNFSVAAPNQSQTSGGTSSKAAASVPDKLRMPQNTSEQHLIKTLNVTLTVKDTRQAANELQAWIGATDPQATSIGTNYDQVSDGVYNITLNFSVQYTLYPKIYSYLSNYPAKDGGHLTNLNETVQDVSNDYVDTQARIANDQNELQRLRDLMQHTGSLSEVLALEQQISATQGDIETTQAHLNMLKNQTTMYTVNITIQPLSSAVPPVQPNSGWNIGQTARDALAASLAFGQGLVSFIVWLLAFSIYLIPVIVLILLYRRYRSRHQSAQPVFYRPASPGRPIEPMRSHRLPVEPTTPPQSSVEPQPVPVGATMEKTDLPDVENILSSPED
jgi:hypothetical protein